MPGNAGEHARRQIRGAPKTLNRLVGFIEVKAGINTKAKSMKTYRERYQPEKAILLSGCGINQMDNGLLHTPLYLAGMTTS